MKTPKSAAKKLFFLSRPKSTARKHPVHAPLPGSGIATKSIIPKYPYFSIVFFFFKTFFLNLSISSPNFLMRESKFSTASIKNNTKGITNIFAAMHTKNAGNGAMSNKEAAINPPLNSKIGIKDIKNIKAYLPKILPVIPLNMPKIPFTSLFAIDNLLCYFIHFFVYIFDASYLAIFYTWNIVKSI